VNDNLNQQRRILLANKPGLLREIFKHAFQRYPDVEIVGEINNSEDISSKISESQADWVLVQLHMDGSFPDFVKLIVRNYPGIGILAISADGSQAKAIWGENSRDDLANSSLQELMNMVRSHLK
jgi:DNA-binding NarL/FixJ family response regulator